MHATRIQLLSVLFALILTMHAVASAGSAGSLDDRISSVEKLIENSSASKTIKGAGISEASIRQTRARELLEQAKRLSNSRGDAGQINALLDESTQEMLLAVRLAGEVGKGDRSDAAAQKEIDAVSRSLSALLEAYVRIRTEQGNYSDKDELHLLVEERLARAEELREVDNLRGAAESLGEAYTATKIALEQLRGGETLIRSLHFDTPAEEYAYEIDRNDSLRMLVDVLLHDRVAKSEKLAREVESLVATAGELRQAGEVQARNDLYAEAIATLEASTIELIRAIRSAGIYIPQ